jgi:hypothetical protein
MRHGRERRFKGVIERSDTRTVLTRLKDGHTIWYAADQDYGRKVSVFAPFFGVSAATITATARFARFNASPAVFISHFRDVRTRTWSICEIDAFPGGDDAEDARRINAVIESESAVVRINTCGCIAGSRRGRMASRVRTEQRPIARCDGVGEEQFLGAFALHCAQPRAPRRPTTRRSDPARPSAWAVTAEIESVGAQHAARPGTSAHTTGTPASIASKQRHTEGFCGY